MSDDIVAELDRWISGQLESGFDSSLICDLMQRARDEIVMWRIGPFALAMTERGKFIRDEALEEATQVVERMSRCATGIGHPGFTAAFNELCNALVDAIRALKDKPS